MGDSCCSPGLMGVVVLVSMRKTRVVLQQLLYCLLCSSNLNLNILVFYYFVDKL